MRQEQKHYDIAIIGGGAAGLFALSGLKGKKTLLLERNQNLGAKLLLTGGGKCNFTNKNVTPANYISSNQHFVKSALAKFTPADFLDILKVHNIKYEERDNGKLFTLDGATKILDAFLNEGRSENLTIRTGTTVKSVSKNDGIFSIITDKGGFEAEKVIVASGGLSLPKIGATSIGYKIAESMGMSIVKLAPGLTSIKYPSEMAETFSTLSGIALPAAMTIGKKKISGELLFTHSGFSGPLALNTSLYLQQGNEVTIDFAPTTDISQLISENRSSKKSLSTLIAYSIPKSLAKALLGDVEYDVSKIRKTEIESVYALIRQRKMVLGTIDGYYKAEVTSGGVSVNDIFQNSMESRKCEGLYFIGEVLDVTGELGGYNLHWAWASAKALITNL